MRKVFVCLIALFLLCGCNTVIYERDDSSTSKEYHEKLSFDASDLDSSYSDAFDIVLGDDDVYINESGTYIVSGKLENASIIIETSKNEEVKLVLDNVEIHSEDLACIYIKESGKVTITLAEGSTNSLSDGKSYKMIDDNDIDGTIYSKADLVFNGTGSLKISANYDKAIVSKDDLIFIDGNYDIESNGNAIVGKDCLKINDGTYNIVSGGDGLKSNNDEDEGRGYVYIKDGDINITSNSDGIQAHNNLYINGGNINITKSVEGLEAAYITINSGKVSIVSTDDGINASGSSSGSISMFDSQSASINITGGELYINASGDGIDSNGDIYISGGNIFVEGPTTSADAAFDYQNGGYISAGEVLMIGNSGMAEGFSDSSTQVNILYNLSSNYPSNSSLVILDNDDNEVFNITSTKQFNSVLVSSSKFNVGDTIKLVINGQTIEYTIKQTCNSEGSGSMSPMGGFNIFDGQKNNQPQNPDNTDGGSFDPSTQQGNFNPEDLPEDFDPSDNPSDFNPEQRQGGPGSGNMPSTPNNMPNGSNQSSNNNSKNSANCSVPIKLDKNI